MFKFKFEIGNEKAYINHIFRLTLNSNRGKEMKHASQAYLISQKEKYSNHMCHTCHFGISKFFVAYFQKTTNFITFLGEKKTVRQKAKS